MPIILPRELHGLWLDEDIEPAALTDLLDSLDPPELTAYPVNPLVGNVRNDTPECIEPAGE